ncbi:MAG: SDR family NAD(P)-dependent oxidoreductase [Proteobacteria bacterium]|nr:SDR family NAD(P)-dependent oxidoreductase [Pseudomonadota bacterium]
MAELRLDGRVAIVTGAAGGLGREYARLLAARGARVVVNDYGGSVDGQGGSPEPSEQVAEEIRSAGGEAVADWNSVVTPEGGVGIVETAFKHYGRIDAVVNNAGIVGGGGFADSDDDMIDRTVATHLRGAFSVARPAWRAMAEQGRGRIVNISSGSVFGTPGSASYPAAKAGMIGLTKSQASEGAALGIKANAVMPVAYTRMTAQITDDDFREFLEEHYQPVHVAPLVAWLCHDDVPCSGEVFTAGGGRVARVFLGVTQGYSTDDLTPEDLRDHWERVMDAEGCAMPGTAMEEVELYFRLKGWDRGRITMGND